jgi:hypothetical protein
MLCAIVLCFAQGAKCFNATKAKQLLPFCTTRESSGELYYSFGLRNPCTSNQFTTTIITRIYCKIHGENGSASVSSQSNGLFTQPNNNTVCILSQTHNARSEAFFTHHCSSSKQTQQHHLAHKFASLMASLCSFLFAHIPEKSTQSTNHIFINQQLKLITSEHCIP